MKLSLDYLPDPIRVGRRWVFADGTTIPVVAGGDGPVDLAALLSEAGTVADLTDEELVALEANLEAAAEERAEALTDEQLAELTQIGEAVQLVRAEAASRIEAAETRQAAAAEALALIRGEEETPDPEVDDPPADTPAEVEVEVEVVVDPPDDPPAETPEADVPEAIAAAVRPAPRIGRVAARRPVTALRAGALRDRGALPDDIADWGLVASANAPNTPAGTPIRTREGLAEAFRSAVESSRGYRHGPTVKIKVAQAGGDPAEQYGPERTLTRDYQSNFAKINRVAGQSAITAAGGMEAITAAGGICAPTPVRYDLPILGTEDRPVRDTMLTRFGADRGGVRVIPPPLLEELSGAVDIWTEANDVSPDDPTVKPCLVMTCPDDVEEFVEAITRCLEIGNFRSRYFPEQVEAWMRLAAVQHARVAEVELLTSIGASDSSTQVTHGQILGTTRDALAAADRATAIISSSNRLPRNFPFRWGVPFWLYNQIRTDQARSMPAGTIDERFAIADATINRFFAARNITATPFLDGESGQIFGRQGDGPMDGWPSTVVTYLYPEGSHLFLDGGQLDLGIFRDAGLTETNDARVFAETFEGHIFHGVESWRLTLDVCPSGEASALIDIDPCSTGS